MSTTVSDIITQSFIDLAVIQPGETISTTIRDAAFLVLQQMYAGWSTEQLTCFNVAHTGFTITAGTFDYTLGPAGTLVTAAVVQRVTGASSRISASNIVNPCRVISWDQMSAELANLGTRGVLTQVVAVDNASGSKNLRVFPTPDVSPATLWLDYWMALTAFSAVSDVLSLPQGFEQALHYNLAIALAPQYARVGGVPDSLAANAQNSKAQIAALNAMIYGQQGQQPPTPKEG